MNRTRNFTTIKYDSNGNETWVKRYQDRYGSSYASAIAVDSGGNVYVTGGSEHTGCELCGMGHFLTIKYGADGN